MPMNASKNTFNAASSIESPCIKVCKIEEATGLCLGCGRSLAEIARWGSMSSAERRAVMNELPQRLKKT